MPAHLKRCDLKKQSQFYKGQNDVKSIITKDYGNCGRLGRQKTKPIQSQFRDNYSYFPCAAGHASLEYAKICANNLSVPEQG